MSYSGSSATGRSEQYFTSYPQITMKVTERRIIFTCSVLGAFAFGYYGRKNEKSYIPYTMIGEFIGAVVGEVIAKAVLKQ